MHWLLLLAMVFIDACGEKSFQSEMDARDFWLCVSFQLCGSISALKGESRPVIITVIR